MCLGPRLCAHTSEFSLGAQYSYLLLSYDKTLDTKLHLRDLLDTPTRAYTEVSLELPSPLLGLEEEQQVSKLPVADVSWAELG